MLQRQNDIRTIVSQKSPRTNAGGGKMTRFMFLPRWCFSQAFSTFPRTGNLPSRSGFATGIRKMERKEDSSVVEFAAGPYNKVILSKQRANPIEAAPVFSRFRKFLGPSFVTRLGREGISLEKGVSRRKVGTDSGKELRGDSFSPAHALGAADALMRLKPLHSR